MSNSTKKSKCPINIALELLGDRWSLLIIRDMIFKNKSSYGEFLNSDEKIATNILANRLLKLEENGFISKEANAENKRKNIYKLNQKGIDLIPILFELILWSEKYNTISEGGKKMAALIKENKNNIYKKLCDLNKVKE